MIWTVKWTVINFRYWIRFKGAKSILILNSWTTVAVNFLKCFYPHFKITNGKRIAVFFQEFKRDGSSSNWFIYVIVFLVTLATPVILFTRFITPLTHLWLSQYWLSDPDHGCFSWNEVKQIPSFEPLWSSINLASVLGALKEALVNNSRCVGNCDLIGRGWNMFEAGFGFFFKEWWNI